MEAEYGELSAGSLPFTFDEFSEWYDEHRRDYLEPAREAAVQALHQLLDEKLPERDRIRVDVRVGRVKSKTRAWHKLNNKYSGMVASLSDIPTVVDDLVGLRLVCTNSSDLKRVVTLLVGLETWESGGTPVLAVHADDSARDYLGDGKPSGYRAYHINLCTSVARVTARHVVVCELQIRTLLQDSWGELTHEDTYKPGSEPPPLVRTLSKRMADLMATLDDMAQDLRDELELLAFNATAGTDSATDGLSTATDSSAVDQVAAYRFIAETVRRIRRPMDLASLAWEMQREFGQDIVKDWAGHGAFKELIAAAEPDVRFVARAPGYVLPLGTSPDDFDLGGRGPVPRAVTLINEVERAFPTVESEVWTAAYCSLAEALDASRVGENALATREISKSAREFAEAGGPRVTRRHLEHILTTLKVRHELRPGISASEIQEVERQWALALANDLKVAAPDLAELSEWIAPTQLSATS